MKAITVEPKKPGTVRYRDFPESGVDEGPAREANSGYFL